MVVTSSTMTGTVADVQPQPALARVAKRALSRVASAAAGAVCAPVTIVLLLGPHIASLSPHPEPYGTRWLTVDAGLLAWCIATACVLCWAVGAAVRRLNKPWLTKSVEHAFVLAVFAGLIANVRYHLPHPADWVLRPGGVATVTVWLIVACVVGYSLANPALELVRRCRQLCQILVPVSAYLLYRLLWLSGQPPMSDALPPPAPPAAAIAAGDSDHTSPVYLLLFDAMSYERTYAEGALRPGLENLAALSEQAITFHMAMSCGRTTVVSMPRLLFQMPEEDTPVYRGGVIGFERDGRFTDCRELESIFSAAADLNYRTAMIGCTVPYRAMLDGKVDVCRSYAWPRYFAKNRAATDHDVVSRLRANANHVIAYWTDPWTHWVHKRLDDRNAVFLRLYEDISSDTLYFLTQQPRNTFLVMHMPVPHWPWIVNEDGSFHGPAADPTNPVGYKRNLGYTDHLIGEFVSAMKEAGTYDDALIIITSDHIWHTDPDMGPGGLEYWTFHVPLVVKLPRQRRPVSVTSRFENQNLRELIRTGLRADGEPDALNTLIESAAKRAESREGPRRLAEAD